MVISLSVIITAFLPQEQRKCLNKVLQERQQLVEAINLDASSIPIPESQPATPPISPLLTPFLPRASLHKLRDTQAVNTKSN